MSDDEGGGAASAEVVNGEDQKDHGDRKGAEPAIVKVIGKLQGSATTNGEQRRTGEFQKLRHEVGANDQFLKERAQERIGDS